MKFDRSNKFDLCYYGQVNSLRVKSSVVSKWTRKHLWGNIYFAGDGTSVNVSSVSGTSENVSSEVNTIIIYIMLIFVLE